MKGSEFLAAYASDKAPWHWEAAALQQAKDGGLVSWPMVPVTAMSPDGMHKATYFVSSDYVAVGTPEDYVRLPLTPITAQKIANVFGMLLPTPKMVKDIWGASQVKLSPQPMVPNKGANLQQYADHSRLIDAQLATPQGSPPAQGSFLISGQKKDIVISNIMAPGKVVIFGWYNKDGSRIQPRTNVHGDFYVDYSHGVRLVSPKMNVDGTEVSTADVLRSSRLSSLLSDEGPLKQGAYPVGQGEGQIASRGGLYQVGSGVIVALGERRSA
jgi:hypothetical protein